MLFIVMQAHPYHPQSLSCEEVLCNILAYETPLVLPSTLTPQRSLESGFLLKYRTLS